MINLPLFETFGKIKINPTIKLFNNFLANVNCLSNNNFHFNNKVEKHIYLDGPVYLTSKGKTLEIKRNRMVRKAKQVGIQLPLI